MVIQGIIRPPPEIRAVADRTALYVAKNGRTFETRILNSAKGQTPKFAFLHGTSPFHAYYEERILFYENGGIDEKENDAKEEKKEDTSKAAPAIEPKTKKTQKASAIDPIAKALLVQRTKIAELRRVAEEAVKAQQQQQDGSEDTKPAAVTSATTIPPPPQLNFVQIVAPASLSVVQLETIQLTAQFTALSSSSLARGAVNFLQELTVREWNNPVFAFCQPRHGHFAYFSALVDAYRRILNHWSNADQQQQANDHVKAMANNVDHCLVVAAYRAEYQRDKDERARLQGDGPVAAKIDWHDFVVVETIDFAVDEIVAMLPPPPPPPPLPTEAATAIRLDEMDESSDEEEETIRVVPSYTPKVYASHVANQMETVIDPISGKSVAIKDMPEHMRIQLLDPKWAEERKKFQDKQKESNLVSGDVVASNLERFAQARGDRFGKKEQDLLSQEAESKKRLEEANRIIREQAQSQRTVGPALPGQERKEPPTGSQEPPAKRPKVTYAPTALPPLVTVAPVPPSLPLPPPVAPVNEDPFAAAGAQPLQTGATAAANQELIPEAEFAASLAKPEVTIQIRVPNDPSQMAWNFYGQIVSLPVNIMSQVKTVKGELSTVHLNGMPANKIQLKNPVTGAFLKDGMTLAALNIGPSTTLELVPRARGGKKK